MILTLWIIFLTLSLTLIYFGRRFESTMSDLYILAGWFFIFVLGILLLFNQVNYKLGETQTTINTYEEDNFNTSILINSTTTITPNLITFENESDSLIGKLDGSHIFGFLISILGGFGFVTFWFDIKKRKQTRY